jgi:hypothetical protein
MGLILALILSPLIRLDLKVHQECPCPMYPSLQLQDQPLQPIIIHQILENPILAMFLLVVLTLIPPPLITSHPVNTREILEIHRVILIINTSTRLLMEDLLIFLKLNLMIQIIMIMMMEMKFPVLMVRSQYRI